MSENKFIQHLKGKATAGSVVEIKNQATPASFANMSNGTSNANNVYADIRGNATVVAQGTTNWKLDSANLVLASNVSGDGNDYTGVYGVSGAGLWVNATYTFPSTGDSNHPVAMIFNPNTKWVLKLCGDNLLANGANTIDFSLVITIGSSNIITKNFTVTEQANKFCKEFVIDFAESNADLIKAQGTATMQVQLLCATASATARIYNGMTVFTALQRKVDASVVSGSFANVEEVMRDGILPNDYFSNAEFIDQVADGKQAYAVFERDGDNVNLAGWTPKDEIARKEEIIVKSTTIPTASADLLGAVYQYVGQTGGTYEHGYIYECVAQTETLILFDPVGTGKLGFDYANHSVYELFERIAAIETTFNAQDVVSGSFRLDKVNELWYISGYDSNGNALFTDFTVEATGGEYCLDGYGYIYTFLFPDDYEDVHTENYRIQESHSGYAWERIDVQPGGSRGRFLALWDCTTGLAETNPPISPYEYKTGDYFIVGVVGATNYKPDGTSYVIGVASTTVETKEVAIDDTYFFDGTQWKLQSNSNKTVSYANLAGDIYDSTSAANALNAKADKTVVDNHIANTSNPHSVTKAQVGLGNVDNTNDLNKPISTATQTALDLKADKSTTYTKTETDTLLSAKQDTISDLATIRSDASAGKSANDTIATYGDIVTHDVSEFATAAQGAKADTALQPGDNITQLVNNAGYLGVKNAITTSTNLDNLSAGVYPVDLVSQHPQLPTDLTTAYGVLIQFTGNYKPQLLVAGIVGECEIYYRRWLTGSSSYTIWEKITPESALATVATTGDYDDLLNKPAIPTVNDATITITQGGVTKGSFTLNQASGDTIALDAGGGGSSTLAGLSDVTITSPATDEVLTYDGSKWVNAPQTGGYHPDLFDYKWADHEISDMQWLSANAFSWQSGSVYSVAYQHLVDDISGKTAQSETVGGITISFYLADDGHKITTDESAVAQIYTATGVAWYYVLDTVNQRFKLPRIDPDRVLLNKSAPVMLDNTVVSNSTNSPLIVGNVATGNGSTGNNSVVSVINYTSSTLSGTLSTGYINNNAGVSNDVRWIDPNGSLYTDFTASSGEFCGKKYLYFYVGSFSQTAVENTAGLNASLFNGKADTDLMNTAANVDFVVERQEPNAGNGYTWYRKYKSGWVEQGGRTTHANGTGVNDTVTLPVAMTDTNYTVVVSSGRTDGVADAAKGIGFSIASASSFYITMYTPSGWGSQSTTFGWYVAGIAA